jgi:DNA-binding MarR family transcriptional regulator
MADAFDPALSIRAALNRKALADARHRTALARRLGVTPNEMLAIQYLARAGELTVGQLATQLQLSSGGTTSLVRSLKRAGHITRQANPIDGRSMLLRLTPAMERCGHRGSRSTRCPTRPPDQGPGYGRARGRHAVP